MFIKRVHSTMLSSAQQRTKRESAAVTNLSFSLADPPLQWECQKEWPEVRLAAMIRTDSVAILCWVPWVILFPGTGCDISLELICFSVQHPQISVLLGYPSIKFGRYCWSDRWVFCNHFFVADIAPMLPDSWCQLLAGLSNVALPALIACDGIITTFFSTWTTLPETITIVMKVDKNW